MFSFHDKFCNRCNNYENSFRKFITTPLWLFLEIENEIKIEEDEGTTEEKNKKS